MKRILFLFLSLCLALAGNTARAQSVWSGADFANSPNWSDVTNWVSQIAPSNGSTVVFTGATGTTPVMDQAYTILSLTFDTNTTAPFTIGDANSSVLQVEYGVTNDSGLTQILALPVEILNESAGPSQWLTLTNGVTTVNGAVSDQGNGLAAFGSGTLELAGSNTFTGNISTAGGSALQVGGSGDLGDNGAGSGSFSANITNAGTFAYNSSAKQSLLGIISGAGSLTINGNGVTGQGQVILNAANTYTGTTTVNNDLLLIGPANGDTNLGAAPASLVANQLTLNNNMNGGANNFGLVDNGGNPSSLTLSSNRGIFLGANGGSISCYPGASMYVTGPISGTGPLYVGNTLVSFDGYVNVDGQCSYTGATIISGGWLFLGTNNCLPIGTPLTIGSSKQAVGYGSFFNMNGFSQTIGPLSSSIGVGGGGPNVGTPAVEFGAAGATLTVYQTNANTIFEGIIGYSVSAEGGNLVVTVPSGGVGSTLTLENVNTYTGTTTITMAPGAVSGPTLAIASNPSPPTWSSNYGAISNSSAIIIGAGGTFDVSQLPSTTFNLSSATSLGASGTGTSQGTTAATINGASGGTVNLGSQPLFLTYTPTSFSGDSTHPALYISQGSLSLNGNAFSVNNASGTPLGIGTYVLIEQASGSVSGSGSYAVAVSGSGLSNGCSASIQINNPAGTVDLVVATASAQTDVWNGGDYSNSKNWSDATNWQGVVAPTLTGNDNVYFAGVIGPAPVMNNSYAINSLIFNSGAGSFSVTNSGGGILTVGSGVTNNSTSAQTLAVPVKLFPDGSSPTFASQWNLPNSGGSITVLSNISDAGTGLTLSGPGPLILKGTNNYSGPTTIGTGSILVISNAGNMTSGATAGTYASAITNNGTFIYNSTAAETLSGIISGTGALTQVGTGTLTLSGVNTYAGITTISNGSLVISKDSNLGAAPATAVTNQLYMNCNINNGANDYGLRDTGGTFSMSATRGITLGPLGGSINVQGGQTLTVPGIITGSGPFYASPNDTAGYGTIILSGANTYTGGTFIGAGTLELGANNTLPMGTPLTIGQSGQGANDGAFFNMNGFNQTIGPLASSRGIGANGNSGSIPTVELTGALTILQTNVNTVFAGVLSGSGGSLTVNVPNGGTPSTLTLSGTNTYTGPTAINGGTLALATNGSINSSSSISIAAGGTFDVSSLTSSTYTFATTAFSASGDGATPGSTAATIKGASGGTVSLGTQPISLTFTPTSFNGDTNHPSLYVSQGALTFSGNTITVSNASATPLRGGTNTLIQVAGGSINSAPNSAATVTGSGLAAGATASISVSGGNVNLVVTAPTQPGINSFSFSGGNFVFSGTNGPANSNYVVLMTTNVALPLSQWTAIATNMFSGTGTFSATNSAGGNSKAFYTIEVQ